MDDAIDTIPAMLGPAPDATRAIAPIPTSWTRPTEPLHTVVVANEAEANEAIATAATIAATVPDDDDGRGTTQVTQEYTTDAVLPADAADAPPITISLSHDQGAQGAASTASSSSVPTASAASGISPELSPTVLQPVVNQIVNVQDLECEASESAPCAGQTNQNLSKDDEGNVDGCHQNSSQAPLLQATAVVDSDNWMDELLEEDERIKTGKVQSGRFFVCFIDG